MIEQTLRITAADSFAEHDLGPEPDRTDQAGADDGDDGLESIALNLFDALSPTPQMLEIGALLAPWLFLDPERGQDGCDRLEDDGIEIAMTKPLLFGQRLGDNGPDLVGPDLGLASLAHRLMIRATFSNPRLAK